MSKKASQSLAELCAEELKRMAGLRMQMLELHPFWGYLLMQVKLVPAPELEAVAATDCLKHIWFNPKKTRHLDYDQLGFVLAHEVGHQVFASLSRRRGRNPHLWNCATDYAINRIVAAIEHPGRFGKPLYRSPNGSYPDIGDLQILQDEEYDGLIAEAIYEYLASDELPEPVSVTLTLNAPGQGGKGYGEVIRVPNLTDHGGGIDVHLPDGLSDAQREELEDRIGAAVESWASQEERGQVPAEALRHVELKRQSKVSWQRIFQRIVGSATAKDDYSLARPNRRYQAEDIVVPGLYSEKAGLVVVALDTSGSMSVDELAEVGAELEAMTPWVEEITLLVADARVQQVVKMNDLQSFLKVGNFKGGGGTDHRPVFAWIEERRLRPDLFIGLTDLYSAFPDKKPPYPVLWVAPESHGDAPWGKILELA